MQPTVSWHRDEYDALGVPFTERGAILDEQLEVWAKAWRGSPVNHDGERYSFGPIWMEPQPARTGGPPLWFGGSFPGPDGVADLDQALAAVPAQVARAEKAAARPRRYPC